MTATARTYEINTDKVQGTVRVLSQGISIVSQLDGAGRNQPLSPDFVLYIDANGQHTVWENGQPVRTVLGLSVKRGNGEHIGYHTNLHMMRTPEGWQHRDRSDQFQLAGRWNMYAGKRDASYLVAALVDLVERIERDDMDFLLAGERARLQDEVRRADEKVADATEFLRAATCAQTEATAALAKFDAVHLTAS
jgi:hypothetical protein